MNKKEYICPEATVIFINEAQHLCAESEWTDEAFGKEVIVNVDYDNFDEELFWEEEEMADDKMKISFSLW